MYETLMGPAFARLSPAVQSFHRLQGIHLLHGWVRTEAPASRLAQLFAMCLGTPKQQSEGVIRFELDAAPRAESWIRYFPLSTMRSTLRLVEGELTECLGLTQLSFSLAEVEGMLVMRLNTLRCLGVSCPRWAMPKIVAEERGTEDGRFHFRVSASLPLIGRVTSYSGYLAVETAAVCQ